MAIHDTVLIVEDEMGVREVLHEALSLYGYLVITATTVQEAESALQSLDVTETNLVIIDINLTPVHYVQEGYALYQRWSALYPTLRFILISGDPNNQELTDIRSGAVRFVAKPFEINALLEVVREVLGR
jgi:two-component system, cell cycle sensor histidine kinase and response regulator CckA